jgi:hypothetical protein
MDFLYLQDDFKVASRLTLNLGLRYEYGTPQWERDNKLANFDSMTNTLVYAKNGSLYDRSLVHPDRKDFAPRVGLAYSLSSKTVIRSGYGISYLHFNRMGNQYLLAYNGPYIVLTTISQLPSQGLCTGDAAPSTCFRPTQMGYPVNLASPANFSTTTSTVNAHDPNTRAAYVQSWHFTIQRELARNLLLDVAYVGNRGVGLLVFGDYNQARPNLPGQSLTLAQRRPLPNFSSFEYAFNGGFSDYNGLQAKLEKKYAAGVYLLNSFAWSKTIDNSAGHMEASTGDSLGVNFYDLRSQKGISSYDQPLNNTTALLGELPFGHGKRFGGSMGPAADAVLGGWDIAAINTMTSGQPVNLTYTPSSLATVSSVAPYRPNITGDPMMPAGQRSYIQYLNPNTVQIPDYTQPFGNAGRNIARSMPFYQLDFAVHKTFPLRNEYRRLEFRAELFNAFNKTNFSPPDGNRSNATFGTISSTFPARQIQVALRFAF